MASNTARASRPRFRLPSLSRLLVHLALIVGALLCAPVFAYLVHLWLQWSNQR